MAFKKFPTISFLIPTLNAESVLDNCLKSISIQDYPKEKIEIIVADGGSTDKTLDISKKYKAKIFKNSLKTGEAGKAVALKHAKNDLVALIDSDNILPDKNWLKRMVEPFSDFEIIGSEPWEYTYRKQDGFIDRYSALMGMNDPFCYFLGNYDRLNTLSGKWTGLTVEQEDKKNWIKLKLVFPQIPTIGANGTILRKKPLIESNFIGDYFFDIDVLALLAEKKPILFAKVKVGIIHKYCGNDINKFIRKQKRRLQELLYYQKIGIRKYPWQKLNSGGLLKFILSCVTIFPLISQTFRGYLKKKDSAWFFHPIACIVTLVVYGESTIKSLWKAEEMSRKNWRQ